LTAIYAANLQQLWQELKIYHHNVASAGTLAKTTMYPKRKTERER